MNTTALLATTYFGPVQWYQKLHRHPLVLIEANETYQKQTFRNRCHIATAQGVQALTVPVVNGHGVGGQEQSSIRHTRISDHGNWRHLHWQAITSAYGDSPFFEYYEYDLRPFFFESNWEFLLDFNEAIRLTMCELIDIHPKVQFTTEYAKKMDSTETQQLPNGIIDFRDAIRPKQPPRDTDFHPLPYYQVFAQRHGFLPNLSILDLLCNMGPEGVFFL